MSLLYQLTDKKPVIVFFHPGGYLTWTGRSTSFGPQYIMNKDIVLVTSNFRLGALGTTGNGNNLMNTFHKQYTIINRIENTIDNRPI